MLAIYEGGLRLKPPYRASRFRQMVLSSGGLHTAHALLSAGDPSEGFTQLFLRGSEALKLTVEYLALTPAWKEMFSEAELATARSRLISVRCALPE